MERRRYEEEESEIHGSQAGKPGIEGNDGSGGNARENGKGMKRKVDLIVIHCSASKETVNYTFEQCIKDHRARGFVTCGYHRFIARDGTIYCGRQFEEIGAHVKGHNTRSIGICYEGGLDKNGKPKDTRTDAQKEALEKCILEAVRYGEGSITRICGHRDLSPDLNGNGVVEPDEWVKSCPCYDASEHSPLLNAI